MSYIVSVADSDAELALQEILSRSNTGHKVEPMTVEPLDVWAIDIQMSTGDGKPKEVRMMTPPAVLRLRRSV